MIGLYRRVPLVGSIWFAQPDIIKPSYFTWRGTIMRIKLNGKNKRFKVEKEKRHGS